MPPQSYIETLQSDTPSHQPYNTADNQHVSYAIDGPTPTSVIGSQLSPQDQQQYQQHFYERQHNPTIYNGVDSSSSSGVGHVQPVLGTVSDQLTVPTAASSSSTFASIQDSAITPVLLLLSSKSASVTIPPVAATITSSNHSSSFMDSIFKKKHHRRRSSSVLGWDSDDDEIMDRTTVTPSEHPSSSSSQVQTVTSEKSSCNNIASYSTDGQNGARPGIGAGGGATNPREQLHQTIESMFHANTTIIPDPNLRKVFYGLDHTPRGSQEPDCRVNLGSVIEDIKILSQLTSRIRLYGMACRQTEDVMKALYNKASWEEQSRMFWNLIDNNLVMDASTSTGDIALHEQAVRSADTITISKVASRIIGISVGNEVLFRKEDPTKKKEHVPLETLDGYIQEIRRGLRDRAMAAAQLPSPIYSALGQQLDQIPALSNIHPFFTYTSASEAADWAFANFKDETVKAARGKPAMISEVGWPRGPSSAALGPAVPSMENLQTFVDTWVCEANRRNVPYYYFEAFDEPWKNSINPRESQWGLMTVDRKLKVAIPNC
ncbi:hypothetical protein BGX29_006765 [Mortierella sp. GBA35]|nr:hypothetical protein BGX29_006765 [Mortierella sp. GBA35]